MGRRRRVSFEWIDRRIGQPAASAHSPARPYVRSFNEANRSLLLCLATVFVYTVSTQGAEPNTSRKPASVVAAIQGKSDKTNQPAAKGKTDSASVKAPGPPQAPQIVTHLPKESDSNSILTDSWRTRLWQSRILPPDPNEDAGTKAVLQDLIQRLKTVGAERPVNEPAPMKPVIAEPAPAAPGKTDSAAPVSTELPSIPVAKPVAEPNGTLSQAAVDRLNHLVKDPNLVHDPLELAELLFLNNRLPEAAVLYEKALTLTIPNDPATSDDRAWILFQLGSSLRQTNMAKARDTYLKLISEFPNSPWTELAKANGRLINWYESNKPGQLISSPTRE